MWNSDPGLTDSQAKFLNTMGLKQKDNVFTQFPNITHWIHIRWIECSESFNHDLVPIKEECQSLLKINQVKEMPPFFLRRKLSLLKQIAQSLRDFKEKSNKFKHNVI